MTFEHMVTNKYSCDHDGCVAQVKNFCGLSSDAWESAREAGWINRGGKHFCRTHASNRDAIGRLTGMLEVLSGNKATVLDWETTHHPRGGTTHTITLSSP